MMGERRVRQDALFYEFSLERHVPERHLLRSIDRFVALDGLRQELAPFYSEMGRPSIDPELLIRMLIVGYCFGIRSERRLCEEVSDLLPPDNGTLATSWSAQQTLWRARSKRRASRPPFWSIENAGGPLPLPNRPPKIAERQSPLRSPGPACISPSSCNRNRLLSVVVYNPAIS